MLNGIIDFYFYSLKIVTIIRVIVTKACFRMRLKHISQLQISQLELISSLIRPISISQWRFHYPKIYYPRI